VDWHFEAEVFQWRGPAPYFFIATPPDVDAFLRDHLGELTYGWGVIPARVRIGDTEVGTSLIPRDGVYLVPLKVALRKHQQITTGTSCTFDYRSAIDHPTLSAQSGILVVCRKLITASSSLDDAVCTHTVSIARRSAS
jgi:hypothetical protein